MKAKYGACSSPAAGELSDERENLRAAEEDLAEKAEILAGLQAALEHEHQRYQDLFEFAPDAYLLTEANTVICEANQAAATLLNVEAQFLVGKVLSVFIAPEDRLILFGCLHALQRDSARAAWETYVRPRNGPPREVDCTVVSAWDAKTQTQRLRWLIRDMTAQRQLERERAQARAVSAEHARHAVILAERNRMAQELHDTLAQSFTGIGLQLDIADELLDTSPEEARVHLIRARDIARQSITDARYAIQALRSQSLEKSDLPTALARLCEQTACDTGIRVQADVQGNPLPLPSGVESDLFRIGQEAITNALRYAGAEHILVNLTYSASQVTLRVEDNGQGFDPGVARQGFGLQGMRERAARLGAPLVLHSGAGKGTQVQITVPVSPAQKETAGDA